MQFNLTARKFAVLTLAGVISIAGTGIAFAADQSDNGQNGNRFHPNGVNFEEMSAIYQTALDGLVDDGTITQEQSEAVTESMAAKGDKIKNDGDQIERSHNWEHKGPMSSLVDDETITQEQADSIMAAMKDAKESGEGLSDILEELVTDDVLTKEQANAVTESMAERGDRAKPEGDQTEMRTPGERKGPMSTLIDAGTITQEQLDSIQEAMKSARDSGQSFSDILDEMVSENVLTQEQADVISESMPVNTERVKPDGLMPAKGNGQFRSPVSSLVDEGILSQEQANAITEAVKAAIEATRESE